MIGVDLFAGAGGMTLGAIQAGINVRFAVEVDKSSSLTYSHNNKNVILHDDDIKIIKKIPFQRSNDEELIVFGGPPCQGFSTSNQRTRNQSNQTNWLFEEFFRIVKMFSPMPEWVVFENVRGFLETENGLFLKRVLDEVKEMGYTVSYDLLNAVDFGIPQKRTRFFAVASLKGKQIDFSKPIKVNRVTVKDAIGDLPDLEVGASENWLGYKTDKSSAYAKKLRNDLSICSNHQVSKNSNIVRQRYKHIPQGGNWENIPDVLMNNYKNPSRCHTGIYRRLKYDEPSVVIGNFRKNMLVHPTQDRGLSVREAARIQSFPDWYEFKGCLGDQQQQVGNAVPPLLARQIFELIIKC